MLNWWHMICLVMTRHLWHAKASWEKACQLHELLSYWASYQIKRWLLNWFYLIYRGSHEVDKAVSHQLGINQGVCKWDINVTLSVKLLVKDILALTTINRRKRHRCSLWHSVSRLQELFSFIRLVVIIICSNYTSDLEANLHLCSFFQAT